jgi:Fungal chitosanase of glycosyl hydrolase group 75
VAISRVRLWQWLVLVIAIVIFVAILYRWISLERLQRVRPAEISTTPRPEPSATRPPVISGRLETAKLFNGVTVHSTVETPPGTDASTERADPESYVLELKLQARLPAPNKTIDELGKVTPQLGAVLPGLAKAIGPDSVSPLYNELYGTKVKALRDNLSRLDQLLSRHNFYDCQTVLRLQHPQSHRKALLLQADMDVDADGSDSDRMPAGPAVTTNFKPFTSYRWQKKTSTPNPYLPGIEERLRRVEEELGVKTTTADRKRELRAALNQLRDEVTTLKKFSFLIGATDPYIVVPGVFAKSHEVKVGDYAIVVFGDKIYPALVGDVGPNDKAGEASLRIAKEINNLATPYNRPVSDLKVTYLIFAGTAEMPFGPPDLDKIQARCQTLVDEIGGATVPLHHWQNIIPPLTTPTPSASPSPSPTGSPSTPSPSIAPEFTSPAAKPTPASAAPSASPGSTFAFPLASPSPSE